MTQRTNSGVRLSTCHPVISPACGNLSCCPGHSPVACWSRARTIPGAASALPRPQSGKSPQNPAPSRDDHLGQGSVHNPLGAICHAPCLPPPLNLLFPSRLPLALPRLRKLWDFVTSPDANLRVKRRPHTQTGPHSHDQTQE